MQSNADLLRFALICLLPSPLAGALIGRIALRGALAGGLTQALLFAPFLYRDYPNILEPGAVIAVIDYGTVVGIIGYGIRRMIARIRRPTARSLGARDQQLDRLTAGQAGELELPLDLAREAKLDEGKMPSRIIHGHIDDLDDFMPDLGGAVAITNRRRAERAARAAQEEQEGRVARLGQVRDVYGYVPFERPNSKGIGDAAAGFIVAVLYVIFYGGLSATWLYGIWSDVKRGYGVWFVGDIVLPPMGELRGILSWLGYL